MDLLLLLLGTTRQQQQLSNKEQHDRQNHRKNETFDPHFGPYVKKHALVFYEG